MRNVAPRAIAVSKVLEEIMKNDRGKLLTGLISRLGDFQTAEDALQEALISALGHWGRAGIPAAPHSWLMKAAYNKGIDRVRKNAREIRKVNEYGDLQPAWASFDYPEELPDERLRLIFTCCHPELEEKTRVALTLRTVCGLTTREIAEVFLDTEAAMGQRISRAKKIIKAKNLGFSVPGPELWQERLSAVLPSIFLVFTTGYVKDDCQERLLCAEALFLARLINQLRPNEPEIEGLLALMMLTEARRAARVDHDGRTIPLEAQNRQLWDSALLTEAEQILAVAVARRQPGAFQIKAAIADCHMMAPVPDWQQMCMLYRALWQFEPTSVVALNWSVVVAEMGFVELALEEIDALEDQLNDFQPWHAARASIFEKLQRTDDARAAYEIAIAKADHAGNREFLKLSLLKLSQPASS